MRLKEQTGLAAATLPIAAFREHLRLGSGFGEDSLQDTVLEATLRAAIAAIEARTGKALLERTFIWQLDGWRQPEQQALPVAPVQTISWLKTVSRDGAETLIDGRLLRVGAIRAAPAAARRLSPVAADPDPWVR